MEQEYTILIIDDEQDIRERLKNILERRGYVIFTARDGQEGLDIVRNNKIDIIFCDIIMPRVDGLEFLNMVRNYTTRPEIIVITGHQPTVGWFIEAIERDAFIFMRKPLTIEEVLNSLNRAKRRLQEKDQEFPVQ